MLHEHAAMSSNMMYSMRHRHEGFQFCKRPHSRDSIATTVSARAGGHFRLSAGCKQERRWCTRCGIDMRGSTCASVHTHVIGLRQQSQQGQVRKTNKRQRHAWSVQFLVKITFTQRIFAAIVSWSLCRLPAATPRVTSIQVPGL